MACSALHYSFLPPPPARMIHTPISRASFEKPSAPFWAVYFIKLSTHYRTFVRIPCAVLQPHTQKKAIRIKRKEYFEKPLNMRNGGLENGGYRACMAYIYGGSADSPPLFRLPLPAPSLRTGKHINGNRISYCAPVPPGSHAVYCNARVCKQ